MPDRLDELWNDDAHWNRWGEYTCADDPRLVVRGRGTTMYTVNLGHPAAWPTALGALGVLLGALFVPMMLGAPVTGIVSLCVAVIVIFVLCDRAANSHRDRAP